MKKFKDVPRRVVFKVILTLCDISTKEIEDKIHVSRSHICRHLSGERKCDEIDIYIIEKVFGIKIKDYSYNG